MATLGEIGKPALRRGSWYLRYFQVTAGQTFIVGDHVILDSAGTLAIAATSGNDVGNVQMLGIAGAKATDILNELETGRKYCPVWVPDFDGEFLVQIYHGTAASAVWTDTSMDAAASTHQLPLRNQSGIWVANLENDGTNDRLYITERAIKHRTDDTVQYPQVWARYILSTTLHND